MTPSLSSLALMAFLTFAMSARAGETFLEKDGIVSIEAEHYTECSGPWILAQDAMMIKGGAYTDHLRYAIHFSQPGVYRLWLLGSAGPTVDEVRFLFRAEDAPSTSAVTFNVFLPDELGWTDQRFAIRVRQPGWYRLLLVKGKPGRDARALEEGPGWRIDKIVVSLSGTPAPSGDGPDETVNRGEEPVPEQVRRTLAPLTEE